MRKLYTTLIAVVAVVASSQLASAKKTKTTTTETKTHTTTTKTTTGSFHWPITVKYTVKKSITTPKKSDD